MLLVTHTDLTETHLHVAMTQVPVCIQAMTVSHKEHWPACEHGSFLVRTISVEARPKWTAQ